MRQLSSDHPLDEGQIWKRYAASRNKADFDRLVEHYLPLVKVAAGRLALHLPSFIREEDLYSAGCVGILSAVQNYDTSRDVRFETYALSRVRGSMLDELRSMDMLTRGVRERASKIRAAEQAMRDEGKALNPEAVAELAGISVEELCDNQRALSTAQMASLDEAADDQGHTVAGLVPDHAAVDPLEKLERDELLELVKEEMNDRDRLLVVLYYHEELTLREIGAILGVSESRVSQMHSEMAKRLQYKVERAGKARISGQGADLPKRAEDASEGPAKPKSGDWIA
jgi:RNA polymerase sigma factor FliA